MFLPYWFEHGHNELIANYEIILKQLEFNFCIIFNSNFDKFKFLIKLKVIVHQ